MVEGTDLLALDGEQIPKYLLTALNPPWDILQSHPAYSDHWVVFFLKRSRPVPREAVMEIYQNINFRKVYRIRLWLLRCKTAPPPVSMNLVHTLRWVDLFHSLRQPYLPSAVRLKIESQILEILPRLALGEKITLAKQAPRTLIKHLRLQTERRVVQALLKNYFFTYDDAMFMANYPRIEPIALELLALSEKWNRYREICLSLLRHPTTPRAVLLPIAKKLKDKELQATLRNPNLNLFARRLIHRILEERFNRMQEQKSSSSLQSPG